MGRSIVVLVSSTQRRGAEVFGEQLADSLSAADWAVDFVALQRIAGREVRARPLEAGADGTSGLRPRLVGEVRRLIRASKPDVLLAGGGATLKYTVAAMAGLRRRPALVYTSIGEPAFWASHPLRRIMLSVLLRRVDLITAVSQATADQLVGTFGVDPSKVVVTHPGVPESFLEVRGDSPGSRLGVLFLGSLSSEKDPIAAARAVAAMSSPATLRFVGAGPLATELDSMTQPDQVEVVGPVDDVVPHLRWADVLLLTSKTEGLPGVVLEAGAAGLPVVAFGVGGVAEAVDSGVTGFVHPPGDIAGLAASLDRLAGDPDLGPVMGQAAREKVASEFLLDDAVDRYLAILEKVHR